MSDSKSLSDEDKLILEINRLKQSQEKFVNRAEIDKWAARGCPYEEDEEVLGIYKLFTCSLKPLQSLNKLGSLFIWYCNFWSRVHEKWHWH